VNINILKNLLPVLTAILLISNGCAGRQPQPVQIVQSDDQNKSCEEIDTELKTINREIWKRYPEIKKTKDYNLGVGLLGSLFPPIVPFTIFSDIEKADAVEQKSLQSRYNHLVKVERQNSCGFEHSFIPIREVDTILKDLFNP